MKTPLLKLYPFILLFATLLCSCEKDDGQPNLNDIDNETNIIIAEEDVLLPIGLYYNNEFEFVSVKANTHDIIIRAIDGYGYPTTIQVVNTANGFNLGTHTLNDSPYYGKIIHEGLHYTTYYTPGELSSELTNPTGELFIHTYNPTFNSVNGDLFIQAYTWKEGRGEVRYSVKIRFENIILDDELYQL